MSKREGHSKMYRVEVIYDNKTEFIMAEYISVEESNNYLDKRKKLIAKTASGEVYCINSEESRIRYIYVNGKMIYEKRHREVDLPVYHSLDHLKEFFMKG